MISVYKKYLHTLDIFTFSIFTIMNCEHWSEKVEQLELGNGYKTVFRTYLNLSRSQYSQNHH